MYIPQVYICFLLSWIGHISDVLRWYAEIQPLSAHNNLASHNNTAGRRSTMINNIIV